MRLASGIVSGSPNPPASSAGVSPPGNSSNVSGLPRVSATIRSRTRSSSGPVTTESSSARASPSLSGDSIKPLRIIDNADERLFLGHLCQQAEHRQPDQKPIRHLPPTQAERPAERIALRARQTPQMVQHRRAELMQPGERELHLGLNTRRSRDATS
jgi:hypothetical protein